MATVKSKLKEALQKEKDYAFDFVLSAKTPNENLIAKKWLQSINNIIKVCDDRKRY